MYFSQYLTNNPPYIQVSDVGIKYHKKLEKEGGCGAKALLVKILW